MVFREFTNPFFDKDANSIYSRNIGDIQEQNNIPRSVNGQSNIIDIKMETGTGKHIHILKQFLN